MAKALRTIMAIVIIGSLGPAALALSMLRVNETFGPAPKTLAKSEGKHKDPKDAFHYHPGRCYSVHHSWSGLGQIREDELLAFQGDTDAANAAMAAFEALPVGRKEIRLFPGRGLGSLATTAFTSASAHFSPLPNFARQPFPPCGKGKAKAPTSSRKSASINC